jgi:acetyltransferase-like isoleucine patch superfamily enzyme
MFQKFLNAFILFFPWFIRRKLLIKFWGYKIHPNAKIGLSYVYPKYLEMEEGAKINHFTVAINLDSIFLGYKSSIGRGNWITGFPANTASSHFKHQKNRESKLIIGMHSAITKNHHIDCTNTVQIGNFVTVAGYNSQFLTHSINIYEARQDSMPIRIGDYCFVGTNSVILGGSNLPDYSVLGAKSLLNKKFEVPYSLYAGVPALTVKDLDKNAKYFQRSDGFIY